MCGKSPKVDDWETSTKGSSWELAPELSGKSTKDMFWENTTQVICGADHLKLMSGEITPEVMYGAHHLKLMYGAHQLKLLAVI